MKDQVFISFRGKDSRYGFLSHLKQKLLDGNVNVVTDDDLTGEPLQNIFKYIRNSSIVIVIFSKNYAESDWCLDELVEIKRCLKMEKVNAVIPIFYKVKVASVKKQSGKFGEKFIALQNSLFDEEGVTKKKIKHINSRIKRWKKALNIVTEMIGLSYDKKSFESDFAQKVLDKVNIQLDKIAASEGRNRTQETSKGKQESNQTNNVYFNQFNINKLFLKSLNLESLNPFEDYMQSIDMKPSSRDLKRNNSDLDQIDQFRPYPVEAFMGKKYVKNQESINKVVITPPEATESTIVQKPVEDHSSNDNIIPRKPIGRTTCIITYLRRCLGLDDDDEQRMI